MFEPRASHQAGLTFFYRGPEWAIAVRQGDLGALTWAMERCSRFWNGAGTLIIPVRADGRTRSDIADHLDTRPVEACFFHDSVPEHARSALARKLGRTAVRQWTGAWDGFDEYELPPLLLQPLPSERIGRRSLRIPQFESRRMKRICLAAWGHIAKEDEPDYRQYFDVGGVRSIRHCHTAMLAGQLEGTSPVEQSVALIGSYGPTAVGRSLFVFEKGSFDELVGFWNLRSRMRDVGNRPMVFGVARESLEDPELLRSLGEFIAADNFYSQKPDIGILADNKDLARSALASLGFEADTGHQVNRRVGGGRDERPLSFGFFGPASGGQVRRGAIVHDQVTITAGEISLRPPRPTALPQSGHYVRVGIGGLPLPMPLADPTAARVTPNGYASPEGLTIKTNTWIGQGYLKLAVPHAWEALKGWAEAREETVELSRPGSYGQALLDRLVDLCALDALAGESPVAVLEALTSLSRSKLAQKVVEEARKRTSVKLSERALADLLAEEAHFLELRARTANDIAAEAKMRRPEILPALGSLVEAGFVVRGATTRCPRCRIADVRLLDEQSETVRCRACGHEYLLPVLDEDGRTERPPVYRLDGLMARAMDQDLLPVLLTLRACSPADPSTVRAAWLGLEFRSAGSEKPKELDLLTFDGNAVTVAECKASASIHDRQLRDLLDLAARYEARPVIAALAGKFKAAHRNAVIERGGAVFERSDLLTG
jgi:hypothetical protein